MRLLCPKECKNHRDKSCAEKGDPFSIMEIWALSFKKEMVKALFQCPGLFLF